MQSSTGDAIHQRSDVDESDELKDQVARGLTSWQVTRAVQTRLPASSLIMIS